MPETRHGALPPSVTPPAAPPPRIGPYAVIERLGGAARAGGAAVYLARAAAAGRPLVIKTVDKRAPGGAVAAAALRREAALAATLAHPNIVAARGFYEDADWTGLLMAPAGITLAARLAASSGASRQVSREASKEASREANGNGDGNGAAGEVSAATRALDWMAQLLDALDYLHGRGVVHGDICPANIFIDADDRLRLGDFGLARRTGSGGGDIVPAASFQQPAGTLSHMAPELLRGAAPHAGSDLFAAAVVFYRLATGQAPFAGTPFQVMQAILAGKVAPPTQCHKIFLTKFDALIRQALAADPGLRYQNTRSFRTALSLFHDASACASDKCDFDKMIIK